MAVVTCLNCYRTYTDYCCNGPISMPCPWCGMDPSDKEPPYDSPIQFIADENKPSQ